MASKTLRFEIFKRDSFTCQYCGKTPPSIILEIDHINPKSNGGVNDINNYITACFDCNRGKGKRLLTSLPKSVQSSLREIKEKQLQLKQYHKYLEKLEQTKSLHQFDILCEFQSYYPNNRFSDKFREVTLSKFIYYIPTIKICEAMKIACLKHSDNADTALSYFCGICWNWIKRPETREW